MATSSSSLCSSSFDCGSRRIPAMSVPVADGGWVYLHACGQVAGRRSHHTAHYGCGFVDSTVPTYLPFRASPGGGVS